MLYLWVRLGSVRHLYVAVSRFYNYFSLFKFFYLVTYPFYFLWIITLHCFTVPVPGLDKGGEKSCWSLSPHSVLNCLTSYYSLMMLRIVLLFIHSFILETYIDVEKNLLYTTLPE